MEPVLADLHGDTQPLRFMDRVNLARSRFANRHVGGWVMPTWKARLSAPRSRMIRWVSSPDFRPGPFSTRFGF